MYLSGSNRRFWVEKKKRYSKEENIGVVKLPHRKKNVFLAAQKNNTK